MALLPGNQPGYYPTPHRHWVSEHLFLEASFIYPAVCTGPGEGGQARV